VKQLRILLVGLVVRFALFKIDRVILYVDIGEKIISRISGCIGSEFGE